MSFFHLLNKQMYIFLDCPVKTTNCNHDIVTTCLVTLNSVVIMLCAYFLFPSIFDFFFSSIVNFFPTTVCILLHFVFSTNQL